MKTKFAAFFWGIALLAVSCTGGEEGRPGPVLKFNSDSRFRIVQFTDIHLQYDSYRSDSALTMMKTVIELEKPDLVVLTGDVVGSDYRKKAWLKVAQVLIDAKVPWAAMLGNHDAEYELDKEQTMDILEGLPYNLTVRGPGEVWGEGNYVLPIESSKSKKTAALCYVFDVSDTNPPPENHTGVYEWTDESQIKWYEEQSAAFAAQNGGEPLPALAFLHIPFPEFGQVAGRPTTYGYGRAGGREISSRDIQSNMFAAMRECGDVMGVFVGHIHNNNYIGCLDDISLAFGQTTGRQVHGPHGAGARVIELYEGQRRFDSWILKMYENDRDTDVWIPTGSRERMFFVSYPDSFDQTAGEGRITMTTEAGGAITVGLSGSGTATVDWGDGSPKETVTLGDGDTTPVSHTYAAPAARGVTITGDDITTLECERCGLTGLDVRGNPALKALWCNENRLTSLDVGGNPALALLCCYDNALTALDVSGNPGLVWLNCYHNRLTDLELRNNRALRRLDCYENRLTGLDFSGNPALHWVVGNDNLFTAEGLNATFGTLPVNTTRGKIYIGGNPGEQSCDRTIAEGKGWTIAARY